MSGTSRKIKNPLLSAAGAGFPFDNYAENAFLVPVTPATPAVLRDDGESDDSFIRKNSSEDLTIQNVSTSEQVTPSIGVGKTNCPKEIKESSNQSAKHSYFSSILSSLPNLSLSTTKSEYKQQTSQGPNDFEGATSSALNPIPPNYSSPTELPSLPNLNQSEQQTSVLTSETDLPPTGITFSAPQSAIPPPVSLPTSGSQISYRLGNQRRLKYAPPPDLTSSVAKQQLPPEIQVFLPSQSNAPNTSTIFNPYKVQESNSNYNSATIEKNISSDHPFSREISHAGSFRTTPVFPSSESIPTSSIPFDLQPPRSSISSPAKTIPVRASEEPATPQNTPANTSFAGFTSFPSNPVNPIQLTSNIDDAKPIIEGGTSVRLSSEVPIIADSSSYKSNFKETRVDGVFTPISAAKVYEKLEYLLAEQEEGKPDLPVVENIRKKTGETSRTQENSIKSFTQDPEPDPDPDPDPNLLKSSDSLETVNLHPNDSLTDIPLDKDSIDVTEPPLIVQELNEISEAATVSDTIHTIKFNREFQQVPSLPNAEFLAEREVVKKPNLNYTQPTQVQPNNYSFNYLNNQKELDASIKNFPNFNEHNCGFSVPQVPQFYNPAHFESASIACYNNNNNNNNINNNNDNIPSISSSFYQTDCGVLPSPSNTYGFAQNNSEAAAAALLPFSTVTTTEVPEPSGSATLNPNVQMSINSKVDYNSPNTVPSYHQNLTTTISDKRMQYRPVYNHWFYRKEVENNILWLPFSMQDSFALEEVYNSSEITTETTVGTDGGRYDVNILRRERTPVYWAGPETEVRRCSWFYKASTESRYVPYEESIATKLEEEYKQACSLNIWNRRVDLSNGEYIIFHSSTVQAHYSQTTTPEVSTSWGNNAGSEDSTYLQGTATKARVVKRGVDEFSIDDGEPEKVDHLLFMVHGIGSVCDLKFRTVEEVVDEFRSISLQLIQSHYRTACDQRTVNRVEVLPISWHTTLHSEATGIDKKLKAITLESIPGLRHFTNDTLLDILFYTSPIYCQTIMETVGSEMNKLFTRFKERNPHFEGGVYLGGHSLGSLILFDLLCHQKVMLEECNNENRTVEETIERTEDENDESVKLSQAPKKCSNTENSINNKLNETNKDGNSRSVKPLPAPVLKRRLSKRVSYVMGAAGTGQPFINYPQLNFHPRAFFALGSPIGMFVTVRGIDTLGEDFALPTCPAFYNMFHPFDPVAYRIESLINPDAHKYRPMLIPHHKGRKRMHLELKETMARVGADLKQKLLDSVRNTWNSVYQLAMFHKTDNLEREIDKVVEEQLQQSPDVPENQSNDDGGADFKVGKLNGGRRIDYVLQEAPFECITNYLSALTSHVCYWESEDTILMILKEIYGHMGIQADAQLPQNTLSIERVSNSSSTQFLSETSSRKYDTATSPSMIGVDPTAPMSNKPIGPPPKTGFVRKHMN